jgi:hypothetical protein
VSFPIHGRLFVRTERCQSSKHFFQIEHGDFVQSRDVELPLDRQNEVQILFAAHTRRDITCKHSLHLLPRLPAIVLSFLRALSHFLDELAMRRLIANLVRVIKHLQLIFTTTAC